MPSARELLEQADALMRRNRDRLVDTEVPELTEVIAEVAPGPVARVIALADVPELVDIVEEIEIASIVELPEDIDEVSEWLLHDPGDLNDGDRKPDSAITGFPVADAPGFESGPERSLLSIVDKAGVAADRIPTVEQASPAIESVPLTSDVASPAAESTPHVAGSTAPAAEIAPPAAESAPPAAEIASPAAEIAPPAAESAPPAAEIASPAAEIAPPAAEIASPAAEIAPPAAEIAPPAAESTPTEPAVLAETPSALRPPIADDWARWEALAEEIRMQVLQRIDIFTDTRLRKQLSAQLQPIVDRAAVQMVGTINEEVGKLLRAYISEAIEREIDKWRGTGD